MEATYAILFTDVVDSTGRQAKLGDAVMASWWEAHDREARSLMVCYDGMEVGRSDGFLMLFDCARTAVDFAVAYHDLLSGLQPLLEARVGIHVGTVALRNNSDEARQRGATPFEVDGIALPTAKRVMSAAMGRQTLLSNAARQALGETRWTVRSHGHWRLKGLEVPIELFEVGDHTAAFAPPPDSTSAYRVVAYGPETWKLARDVPHNLPAERDNFVGRRGTLHCIAERYEHGTRLVTILGAGGIGKTRTALRYATLWLGDYPGGAWLCDLSAARTLEAVVQAVAHGLEIRLSTAEPVRQLGVAIASRGHCLLIVDNFEQVAAHAAATIGAWLDSALEAHILVTSRARLGIPGEQLVEVPPLEGASSKALFTARAAASAATLPRDKANEEAVPKLLDLLDHLPLAIELAAARARVMTPVAMLRRIGERFELLATRGARVERHASLQATLDWSWDMLSPTEQDALMQMSVFEGGFDIDAAEATLALPIDSAGLTVLDAVSSLLDKSLLRSTQPGRFTMLNTVHEYAAARRRDATSAELSPDPLQARHWRYFGSLTETRAVANRCADLENLVAACRAATASGDGEYATATLCNAWAALRLVGPYRVAVNLADAVLVLPILTPEQSSIAHAIAGSALDSLGAVAEASNHLSTGLQLLSGRSPSTAEGRLYLATGLQQTLAGDSKAAAASLARTIELAEQLGDLRLKADALTSMGRLHDHQAQLPEASRCYQAALELARALGDRRLEGGLLGNLGGLLYDLGHIDEARRHYEESLTACEAVGDRLWAGNACSNLGLVLLTNGRHADARVYLNRALVAAETCGNVRLAYTVRCNLGMAMAIDGQLELAEQQFRLALRAAATSEDRRAEGQFLGYLAVTLARQGRLAEAHECLVRGERCLLAIADRLSLALLMCDRAEVARAAADETTASSALASAELIATELLCEPSSELRRRLTVLTGI